MSPYIKIILQKVTVYKVTHLSSLISMNTGRGTIILARISYASKGPSHTHHQILFIKCMKQASSDEIWWWGTRIRWYRMIILIHRKFCPLKNLSNALLSNLSACTCIIISKKNNKFSSTQSQRLIYHITEILPTQFQTKITDENNRRK